MRRKLLLLGFICSMLFVLASCGGTKADIVIHNGLIYTVDPNRTEAQALAVQGDEIVYVGDEEGVQKYIGEDTKVIDLKGGMALPGFIDSHGHPAYMVNSIFNLDLTGIENDKEYLARIEEYLENHPDIEALVGAGWDRPVFSSYEPTKEALDKISTEIPIVLSDSGYHVKWMNSKALEMMGISADSAVPEGAFVEKDASGEPTGLVSDYPGIGDRFASFNEAQYREAIQAYQEMAAQYGITASFEDFPRNQKEGIAAYQALEEQGELQYRTSFYIRVDKEDDIEQKIEEILNLKEETAGNLFRVEGAKIFIDGVLEGETAYLAEPYINNPQNRGEFLWENEEDKLQQLCRELEENHLNYHFHAIGDLAVTKALDAIEFAKDGKTDSATRPGITHVQLIAASDFPRFAELGATAVPQPFWAVYDSYYDLAVEFVGQPRADLQYPIGSLFKAGALVASGSDFPVQSPRPLDGIESGVTRAYPGEPEGSRSLPTDDEKVSLEQMIASYTINGAIANYLEDEVGSLEVGKKADIVILEKNLFTLAPNQIAATKEVCTIFNGKIVYQAASL